MDSDSEGEWWVESGAVTWPMVFTLCHQHMDITYWKRCTQVVPGMNTAFKGHRAVMERE
jgi:hypothetical protein